MRKILPHVGKVRVRCAFLVRKMRIGNQVRWLEFARWEEQMDHNYNWVPYRWINE